MRGIEANTGSLLLLPPKPSVRVDTGIWRLRPDDDLVGLVRGLGEMSGRVCVSCWGSSPCRRSSMQRQSQAVGAAVVGVVRWLLEQVARGGRDP
jgi:hypothetical protein